MVDLQLFLLISLPPSHLLNLLPLLPSSPPPNSLTLSYLYAIVMARHVDTEVESKPIQQFNVTKLCGTVKEIHHGFSRMQDLSMPSEREEGEGREEEWRGRKREGGGGREGGERLEKGRGDSVMEFVFSPSSDAVRTFISGPSLAAWSGILGVAGACSFVPPACQGSHIYPLYEEKMCHATW